MSDNSTHFADARGRKPATFASDHQARLNAAYSLLDRAAPTINRVADVRAAAAPIVASHSPEAAAHRLAEAALDPDVDMTALVEKAIAEHATALAYDSINLQLSRAGSTVAAARFEEARVVALVDVEPVARKTITDLKRSARKLDAVADVFDAVAIVNAEADTAALASLKRSLAALGTIARLDVFPADDFRGLLRYVDFTTDAAAYADPVAKSARTLDRTRRLDLDRALVNIARGRHEGLTLSYTADDAEVSRREQKLDAILSLPVPKFDPFGGTTRHDRRRNAVGPSGN